MCAISKNEQNLIPFETVLLLVRKLDEGTRTKPKASGTSGIQKTTAGGKRDKIALSL